MYVAFKEPGYINTLTFGKEDNDNLVKQDFTPEND